MAGQRYLPCVGLQGVEVMQPPLPCDVGLVSFFWSFEAAEIGLLAFCLQLRLPALCLFVPMHTKKAASIVGLSASPVLFVVSIRCLTEITKSVVRAVSVDVVDLLFRPFSGHVEPRQPVRVKTVLHCAYHDVSKRPVQAAKESASRSLSKLGSPAWEAPEKTGVRVVEVEPTQLVHADFGVCHGW